MKNIRIFKAFSLAEALVTLLIVCLITIASIPVITKKKRVKKEQSNIHGAFACYWDESQQNLIGKYLINGEVTDADIVTDDKEQETIRYFDDNGKEKKITQSRSGCVFNPPAGARNFVVTLVGGGGGGAGGFVRTVNTVWTLDEAGTQGADSTASETYTSEEDEAATSGADVVSGEEGNDLYEETDVQYVEGSWTPYNFTTPVSGKYDFLVLGAGGGGGAVYGDCIDDNTPAKAWPCGTSGSPGALVVSRDNHIDKGTKINIQVGAFGNVGDNNNPGGLGGDSHVEVEGVVDASGTPKHYIWAQGGGGGASVHYPNVNDHHLYKNEHVDSSSCHDRFKNPDIAGPCLKRSQVRRDTNNGDAQASRYLMGYTISNGEGGYNYRNNYGPGIAGGYMLRGFNNSEDTARATDLVNWSEYEKRGSYLLDEFWEKITKFVIYGKTFTTSNTGKLISETFNARRPYRNPGMTKELMEEFGFEDKENQVYPFGSGGAGSLRGGQVGELMRYGHRTPQSGGRGVVAVKYNETYGGLGGRAGKVLQLPYAELPKGTVVFPGKGGFGGGFVPYKAIGLGHLFIIKSYSATNGLSSYMKNGQEVLGGSGAVAVDTTDPSTYYRVNDDNTSIGQNGEMASVAPKEKAAGGAGGQTSKEQNSYINNTANFNGLTRGVFLNNKAIGSFNEIVGAGAGGGGGGANINSSPISSFMPSQNSAQKAIKENYGLGARGSSGLVFIQW